MSADEDDDPILGASGRTPGPDDEGPEGIEDDDDIEDWELEGRTSADSEIEASLNDALSDLERMLQRHGDGAAGEVATHAGDPAEEPEEPFTIPLLEEMVIPGPGIEERRSEPLAVEDHAEAPMDENSVRRRLAERLASEIEVIVQDRFEAALERARDEVREQVRNHMDIILPEILEELRHYRDRD